MTEEELREFLRRAQAAQRAADLRPLERARREFLIWSIEHQAWWRPGRRGYSLRLEGAGVYSEAEALEILKQANFVKVNEAAIPLAAIGPDRRS